MKIINRNIEPFQEKDFFSPVRNKLDYAHIVLNAAKIMLLNISFKEKHTASIFKVKIARMSRIFVFTEGKFFSLSFPFNVQTHDGMVSEISTYSGIIVNSMTISFALSFLEEMKSEHKPSLSDLSHFAEKHEYDGLYLLEEILLLESAYLRYDHDIVNANGRLHPLHHLDLNYSSYGTYKLGLSSAMIASNFEDILDIDTDCTFLA